MTSRQRQYLNRRGKIEDSLDKQFGRKGFRPKKKTGDWNEL